METLVTSGSNGWKGRDVLVTGHTGFKGGWLALWLHRLGAAVHGFALDPPTDPALFDTANVGGVLASDTRADLADRGALEQSFKRASPQVVFHLAAQPLVRAGYDDPLGTLVTNVMGTAHVLDVARHTDSVRAVIVITTDKVYENREWDWPYRELDALGGHDPYSASKAAAELVATSYCSSFFCGGSDQAARIATARAGNVIGGGDWATDRLLPDCLSAFSRHGTVRLRNPNSVRPWQHVLEPLAGYLLLAERLMESSHQDFAGAWNFGPLIDSDATVSEVAETVAGLWGHGAGVERVSTTDGAPHEAGVLRLDSTKARTQLGWQPRWSLEEALDRTVTWYKAWDQGDDMRSFTVRQIAEYEDASRA